MTLLASRPRTLVLIGQLAVLAGSVAILLLVVFTSQGLAAPVDGSIAPAAPGIVKQHNVVDGFFKVVTLLAIGVHVGVIGTLIGAGGGFLVVPLLIILYGFTPQHAVGTSMLVVLFNALSGTFSYVAQKRVDYELGLRFAVFSAPGVIIGALIAQQLGMVVFSILFSLFLLSLAYLLIFTREFYLVCSKSEVAIRERVLQDAEGGVHTYSPDVTIGYAGSFLVGILSGLFGIGGGLIHVPLMTFIGIPIHIAAATSHFMIVITSFFGLVTCIGLNSVDMDYGMFIGAGSILGAYFGAKLSSMANSELIKSIISIALILVALKLILNII